MKYHQAIWLLVLTSNMRRFLSSLTPNVEVCNRLISLLLCQAEMMIVAINRVTAMKVRR